MPLEWGQQFEDAKNRPRGLNGQQFRTSSDCITLRCGHQLLRLQQGERKALGAAQPTVGAADLALVCGDHIDDVLHHLKSYYVDVIAGPLPKLGAEGAMTSVYLRDPDQNLIELVFYQNK